MNLTLGDTRLIINVCAANDLLRNQAAYVLARLSRSVARFLARPPVDRYRPIRS